MLQSELTDQQKGRVYEVIFQNILITHDKGYIIMDENFYGHVGKHHDSYVLQHTWCL